VYISIKLRISHLATEQGTNTLTIALVSRTVPPKGLGDTPAEPRKGQSRKHNVRWEEQEVGAQRREQGLRGITRLRR
jgi:hypothetical protein